MTKHSSRPPEVVVRDERRPDSSGKRPRAEEAPPRERRSSDRVRDEQQSGHGSVTALSKMKMLERKRAAIRPAHDELPKVLD